MSGLLELVTSVGLIFDCSPSNANAKCKNNDGYPQKITYHRLL